MNTPETRAAYVQSQATAAMIEALGMQAENAQRIHRGEAMAYDEAAFDAVINKYGLDHNSIVSFLRGEIKP